MPDELARRLQTLFSRPVEPGGRPPTLRQAAEATGISISYLWRLKAGRTRNPTKEVLTKLSGFFGVPVAYFTGDDGNLQGPTGEGPSRVHELLASARSRLRLRDVEGALRTVEEAERLAAGSRDRQLQSQVAVVRARCLLVKGELEEARRILTRALEVLSSPEAGPAWADAVLAMANLAYYEGRYQDAYLEARHVLTVLERRGWEDDQLRFAALVGAGTFARRVGWLTEFHELYRMALDLARKISDPVFLAAALNGMGLALIDLGRPEEALDYLKQSVERYRDLCVPIEVARVQHNVGLALECLGRWQDAVETLAKSLGILEVFRDVKETTYLGMELGWCYAKLGQREKALEHARSALETAQVNGWRQEVAWAYLHLGQVYRELGELDQSRLAFEAAMELFEALNLRAEWALASADYGDLLAQTGQMDEALKAYRLAVETLLPHAVTHRRLHPGSTPGGPRAARSTLVDGSRAG